MENTVNGASSSSIGRPTRTPKRRLAGATTYETHPVKRRCYAERDNPNAPLHLVRNRESGDVVDDARTNILFDALIELDRQKSTVFREKAVARELIVKSDFRIKNKVFDEVADYYGVSSRSILAWEKKQNESGSLKTKPRSGRPIVATPRVKLKISEV